MATDDDYAITRAMIRFGGSFVRTLGQLWLLADEDNRVRLKTAFPEYWTKYAGLAADAANDARLPSE